MLLVLGVTFALICKEAPSLAWLKPLERFPNIGHSFDLSVTASAVQSLIIANCACLPVPLISFQNLMRPGPRFICLGGETCFLPCSLCFSMQSTEGLFHSFLLQNLNKEYDFFSSVFIVPL